jgi:hypothetical protein
MSEPGAGMGSEFLIDLGLGSTTNSAYASIALIGCSADSDAAKAKAIIASVGAKAIYRNDDLTTIAASTSWLTVREDVTCDATASFRWIHASRLIRLPV